VGLFDRFRRRGRATPGQGPTARTRAELETFMAERDGVEAYLEPRTQVYAMSLCVVAADGEFIRRPVKDERQARELCTERGVPLYDARIVGYPRRMQDYQRGVRSERIALEDLPPLDVTGDAEPDD
jgi:hypothetical protein